MKDHSIAISLGRTCIGIRCEDEDFLAQARRSYQPFLATREPDFWIELRLRTEMSAQEVRGLLPEIRGHLSGDRFTTEPKLLDFRVDWVLRTLSVATENAIFDPSVEYKLMNHLLSSVYYGIWRRIWGLLPDAYLVHGCAIVEGGGAYVFTGPSGIGKTTVARLAEGRTILNDEMVLVGKNDGSFSVSGTPFDGGVSERCGEEHPLLAIYFLRQDDSVSLHKLSSAESYVRLLGQTLDNTLFGIPTRVPSESRMDFAAQLAAEVSCYQLAFRMDTSFWTAVEQLEVKGGLQNGTFCGVSS